MRLLFLPGLFFCIINCSAQNVELDSLTRDSLLRSGYEQCAAIFALEMDTCTGYDSAWINERTCYKSGSGDSIASWGVHQGCCQKNADMVYDDGRLIGTVTEESGYGNKNSALYYVGDFVIEATWEREYCLRELRLVQVTIAGSMFIVPPSATIPTLTVSPR